MTCAVLHPLQWPRLLMTDDNLVYPIALIPFAEELLGRDRNESAQTSAFSTKCSQKAKTDKHTGQSLNHLLCVPNIYLVVQAYVCTYKNAYVDTQELRNVDMVATVRNSC